MTLLFGCAFTAVSIIAGNRRDELLKRSDLEREERIAQARGLAASANERAAGLEATAETARAEQKRLESDVERSRVDQEKVRQENLKLSIRLESERAARLTLEERLSPRRLTDNQRASIERFIRSMPKQSIRMMTLMGSVEALQYAESLKDAIQKGGWDVDGINQGIFTPNVPLGIWIIVRDPSAVPPAADMLAKALTDATIQFQAAVDAKIRSGDVELRVGAKP